MDYQTSDTNIPEPVKPEEPEYYDNRKRTQIAHVTYSDKISTIFETEDGLQQFLVPTKELRHNGWQFCAVILVSILLLLILSTTICRPHLDTSVNVVKPFDTQTEVDADSEVTEDVSLHPDIEDIPIEQATEEIVSNAFSDTNISNSKHVYVDDRIPNYSWTENLDESDLIETAYEITANNGRFTYSSTLKYYRAAYDYYKSLPRYYKTQEFNNYINDDYNMKCVENLMDIFLDIQEQAGISDSELLREVVNFVQNLEYQDDLNEDGTVDEWPKYPIETLCDGGGDCEDTSILLASMLKQLGYSCAFVSWDDHMGVAILGDDNMSGSYYEIDGQKYFYIETTTEGWQIGELEPEYEAKSATITLVE